MKTGLYWLIQCTWGLPQTLLGLVLCLLHRRDERFLYHGAVVTRWQGRSSMSVGPFVFLTANPFFADQFDGQYTREELSERLLVHEYGHAVQSLFLGPLFLPIMGIPSFLWCNLPPCRRLRREKGVSYYSFYPESTANRMGRWATKLPCELK